MPKHCFTYAERYAVWLHNDQRCWLCGVPIRLADVTVDHVIPESMEEAPDKLQELLADYDLPTTFRINGFENWLPAHASCNASKSSKVFKMVPAYRLVFDHLLKTNEAAQRTSESIRSNIAKDKLLAKIASAIDSNTLSLTDLSDFLSLFAVQTGHGEQLGIQGTHAFIKLDNGYWIRRSEIAAEGLCQCERSACVGHAEKIYCYFSGRLSPWVLGKRMYHRCYDELVQCPRCLQSHKRGHIGREGSCGNPFSDQEHQVDTRRSSGA